MGVISGRALREGPLPSVTVRAYGRGARERAISRGRRAPAVAAIPRARHGRDPGLLARAPGADVERGRQPHRHHARDRAAHPAHPREARPRALRRAAVLAHAPAPDPWVGLSVVAEPLRARAAA